MHRSFFVFVAAALAAIAPAQASVPSPQPSHAPQSAPDIETRLRERRLKELEDLADARLPLSERRAAREEHKARLQKEPGWSDPVSGLRLRIEGGKYLNPKIPISINLSFWNDSEQTLAVTRGDAASIHWELRDPENQIIKPAELPPPAVTTQPAHPYDPSTTPWLDNLQPHDLREANCLLKPGVGLDDTLTIGTAQWRLRPGNYTLRATFTGPSQNPQGKLNEGALEWKGKIEIPPLVLVATGTVSPDELAKAAAALRAKPWTNKGDLYNALAELLTPGMPFNYLQIVFPEVRGGGGGGDGNGFAMFSAIDADFRITIYGQHGANTRSASVFGDLIIYAIPTVQPKTPNDKQK